jgi:hypothetical protein
MMDGIQWSSTMRAGIARQSCPFNQLGVATRECSSNAEWMSVRSFNCTLVPLFELSKKYGSIGMKFSSHG